MTAAPTFRANSTGPLYLCGETLFCGNPGKEEFLTPQTPFGMTERCFFSSLLGSQCLLLVFIDLEDLLQARELHHLANGFVQPIQDQAGSQITRGFQTFDKGSDAGAVNIADILEVQENLGRALLFDFAEQGLAHDG